MNILIVDDDRALAKGIQLYLDSRSSGYDITIAETGAEALEVLERVTVNLMVLDILLPDMNGYDLCKQIKNREDLPIVFLSSLGAEENRIKGFLSGGDDYVVKPFSLAELEQRIAARLRDKSGGGRAESGYQFGELRIEDWHLIGNEKRTILTEKELEILLLLARQEGKLFSLQEIYEIVWKEVSNNDLRTVQAHMSNLRRKLQEVYPARKFIFTKWGKGYVFQR